jgi:flagellar motor switch protein FliM
MADEVLSQAELQTLLSNLESGLAPKVRASANHGVPAPHLLRLGRPDSAITSRITTLPGRFGQETMVAIRALHEGFGRSASAALSAMLRSVVEVKLAWAEQLAYGEFVERLPNPTCATIVRAAPLAPNWLLNFETSILYAIIDRLLGGGGEQCPVARRPLTEIELRLAARVARLLLEELKKTWQPLLDLDFSIERVESNPRLVLSARREESVVLLGFESKLNDVRGMLTLCIPTASLEGVIDQLASDVLAGPVGAGRSSALTSEKRDRPAVEVVVQLAETTISAHELRNLRVGDIITTESDIHSPLAVSVAGITTLRAHPGTFDAHKAVRIVNKVVRHAAGDEPKKP